MSINGCDMVIVNLDDKEIQICLENAQYLCATINDRRDLHARSYMERYIDILMGEAAELAVIKWLNNNGKFAVSAVDKKSGKPDFGHDIILKSRNGKEITCSVKSSLSALKNSFDDILDTFTIATKSSEIRKINVQVYYWLNLRGKSHRTTVPSTDNMAIVGWVGENDITDFSSYNGEERQVADMKLRNIRSMQSLLDYLL